MCDVLLNAGKSGGLSTGVRGNGGSVDIKADTILFYVCCAS